MRSYNSSSPTIRTALLISAVIINTFMLILFGNYSISFRPTKEPHIFIREISALADQQEIKEAPVKEEDKEKEIPELWIPKSKAGGQSQEEPQEEEIKEGMVLNAGKKKLTVNKEWPINHLGVPIRGILTWKDKYILQSYKKLVYYNDNFEIENTIELPADENFWSVSNNGEYYATMKGRYQNTYNKGGTLLTTYKVNAKAPPVINLADDGSFIRMFGEVFQSCITFYSRSGDILSQYYCYEKENDNSYFVYDEMFSSTSKKWAFFSSVTSGERQNRETEVFLNLADTDGKLILRGQVFKNKTYPAPFGHKIFFLNNDKYVVAFGSNGSEAPDNITTVMFDYSGNKVFSTNNVEQLKSGELVQFGANDNELLLIGYHNYYLFDINSGKLDLKKSLFDGDENENVAWSVIFPNDGLFAVTHKHFSSLFLSIYDFSGNMLSKVRIPLRCGLHQDGVDKKKLLLTCADRVIEIEIGDN